MTNVNRLKEQPIEQRIEDNLAFLNIDGLINGINNLLANPSEVVGYDNGPIVKPWRNPLMLPSGRREMSGRAEFRLTQMLRDGMAELVPTTLASYGLFPGSDFASGGDYDDASLIACLAHERAAATSTTALERNTVGIGYLVVERGLFGIDWTNPTDDPDLYETMVLQIDRPIQLKGLEIPECIIKVMATCQLFCKVSLERRAYTQGWVFYHRHPDDLKEILPTELFAKEVCFR